MIAGIIIVCCIVVFLLGMGKVFSDYGAPEGCGMMLVSAIIVVLIMTGTILDDESKPQVVQQVESVVVEEVVNDPITEPEINEDDTVEVSDYDTIMVTETFKPIEPVYDTVEVIEEIIEEVPQYDTLEVIEIESNHKLDIDSLMTAYGSDSVKVEIIQ
jgi:hypothetical protein